MRLLNDLLNMHDGFDNEGWLKGCRKRMMDTFPREDPFSIILPAGFDIDKVRMYHTPLQLVSPYHVSIVGYLSGVF